MKKDTTTRYRNDDGEWITKEEAEKLPKKDYTKEQVPKPGKGDTHRGKKK